MKKQIIRSPQVAEPPGRFSQAVAVEGAQRLTWLSAVYGDTPAEALDRLRDLLIAGGMDLDNVVHLGVTLVDPAGVEPFAAAADTRFAARPPAVSFAVVSALPGGEQVMVNATAAS